MVKLQLCNAAIIYDTDCMTSQLFRKIFNCRYNPRMVHDYVVMQYSDYQWSCCDMMFRLSMIMLWHNIQTQWLCCDAIFRLSMNMLWHDVQTINDHIVTPCSDYRWLCCDIMFRLSMIILWHHVQTQWSYCDTMFRLSMIMLWHNVQTQWSYCDTMFRLNDYVVTQCSNYQ